MKDKEDGEKGKTINKNDQERDDKKMINQKNEKLVRVNSSCVRAEEQIKPTKISVKGGNRKDFLTWKKTEISVFFHFSKFVLLPIVRHATYVHLLLPSIDLGMG